MSLQQAILEDMMPPTSGKCNPHDTAVSFDYESSAATSEWAAPFVGFEEELFLAKMEHTQEENANRTWTMRFGQAGNIYSLYGPMGETVPPQDHTNAPWVDEVWQQVAPLGSGGNHDNDPNTPVYFIHEAGTYTKDSPYTDTPFYSPSLGHHCDNGMCGFMSWVRTNSADMAVLWEMLRLS